VYQEVVEATLLDERPCLSFSGDGTISRAGYLVERVRIFLSSGADMRIGSLS
jgi:hypothetical protein